MILLALAVALSGPIRVLDGDTIVANGEHIRLVAIDAPEMPGHCARNRRCAPGDPFASKTAMEKLVASGQLTIERLGQDHYGRTVGDIYLKGQSLSCLQIRSGKAIYWPRYDQGGRVARECGLER